MADSIKYREIARWMQDNRSGTRGGWGNDDPMDRARSVSMAIISMLDGWITSDVAAGVEGAEELRAEIHALMPWLE